MTVALIVEDTVVEDKIPVDFVCGVARVFERQ